MQISLLIFLVRLFIDIQSQKILKIPPPFFNLLTRTTVSQDVRTWFSVQLAFAKFQSKIKEIFEGGLYPWYWHCNKNFSLF